MTYAAQLIDAAMKATGDTQNALARRIGVQGPNLSAWRHGSGSPMPQERVLELCELAGIPEADQGYWLAGVMRDAVTTTGVRRALDSVLDRIRPAATVAGVLALCAIGSVGSLANSTAYEVGQASIVHYVRNWLRRFHGRSARVVATA